MRTIEEIRAEIKERQKWSLADQNRDSVLFLRLIDDLAQIIAFGEGSHEQTDGGQGPERANFKRRFVE